MSRSQSALCARRAISVTAHASVAAERRVPLARVCVASRGSPLWSSGTGAGVMKRIAALIIGGIVTSFLLELLIYPAIYVSWKWWAEVRPSLRLR